MKEICTEQAIVADSKEKEIVRDLWREAVCAAAIYGKSCKIENVQLNEFDQTIIKNIESQGFSSFGRKKIIEVTSISREISDIEGKSARMAIASYAVASSSEINETRGISITTDNNFAVFLVMRGKKINVETWERYGEICWEVNMVNVNPRLALASRNVDLLQKSLSPKK